ncbi:hypothetical protein INT48_005032 [Thamnidium elegans]|uniref:U6 snRNA phosphodiesterase 1 n=1 Tax=Thamnidium elegans TaxID=101142 RepID=A0A8H7SPE1_9FUNG|nr:hypothetical protein INT48_005032 [Thamnidium elegans]
MKNIVDYPSSSDEETENPTLKRKLIPELKQTSSKKMPKLPSFFGDSTKPESSDGTGKKRTVPHASNSWATYVYFQVDFTDEKEKLVNYCTGLEPIQEQHISLSRTVYLKHHQLDMFVTSVRNAIQNMKSFDISFAQTACLTNDENTRSFLTLEIGNGYIQLLDYMKQINKVMKEYKQPIFYNPPRFHTSIGWALNKDTVTSIEIPQPCLNPITSRLFYLSRLYIKQGHYIHHIDLQ